MYQNQQSGTNNGGMVMAQNPVSGTLAVLDAPVVLTVATQSKGYKGEISFTMEKADQDRTIRVTLMANGQEVEQYSAVYPAGQSGVRLVFDEPLRAITPGQSAVLYDGDTVLGGGIIAREDAAC